MGFSKQEYWSGVPLPSPELRYGNLQTCNRVFCWVARLGLVSCGWGEQKMHTGQCMAFGGMDGYTEQFPLECGVSQ